MNPLRDRPTEGRLEMDVGAEIVFANYRREPGRLVIEHVEAPPVLRGSGASGRFMEALAAKARADGDLIVPLCSYAAAWLKRSPEFADLIA